MTPAIEEQGAAMTNQLSFTVDIHREGDMYVASCREVDIASQGSTVEEAKTNVREAVQLWLETASPAEIECSYPFHASSDVFTTRVEVPYGKTAGAVRA